VRHRGSTMLGKTHVAVLRSMVRLRRWLEVTMPLAPRRRVTMARRDTDSTLAEMVVHRHGAATVLGPSGKAPASAAEREAQARAPKARRSATAAARPHELGTIGQSQRPCTTSRPLQSSGLPRRALCGGVSTATTWAASTTSPSMKAAATCKTSLGRARWARGVRWAAPA